MHGSRSMQHHQGSCNELAGSSHEELGDRPGLSNGRFNHLHSLETHVNGLQHIFKHSLATLK